MAKNNTSAKRVQIDKANARIVVIIAGASALVILSLVASKALLSQRAYQSRVIAEKTKALGQLKSNADAVQKLVISYSAFVGSLDNVLGGNSTGTGDRDGDNAKIVLDALPSKYDFPALATSLEKILTSSNYKIDAITGTDDEVRQQNTTTPSPAPVEIPFQITVSGNYGSIKDLLAILERSIRPIQIQTLEFSGNDNNLRATITAKTFYQPAKDLTITTKEVK
jgi:hypothetical protein